MSLSSQDLKISCPRTLRCRCAPTHFLEHTYCQYTNVKTYPLTHIIHPTTFQLPHTVLSSQQAKRSSPFHPGASLSLRRWLSGMHLIHRNIEIRRDTVWLVGMPRVRCLSKI